ncbi:MAG: recombination protein RecR [Synergistaceae bacterium]|nr:recombination protein RecR [Synergistaceae bacterium]
MEELISALKKLPGIGQRSARRIAFHLFKMDEAELNDLGGLISHLKDGLYTCKLCGNITEHDPCDICDDPLRDRKTLCVVQDVEALTAFEQSGSYNGLYHVLGSSVSPLKDDDLSDEAAEFLVKHIEEVKPDEVIIATNPKVEGDMAYYTLLDVLRNSGVPNITRIAYGLPVGGSIVFADRFTLHTAIEARRPII